MKLLSKRDFQQIDDEVARLAGTTGTHTAVIRRLRDVAEIHHEFSF